MNRARLPLRGALVALLATIGLLATAVAQATWWINSSILDTPAFTRRASSALQSPAVQDALAETIIGRLDIQGIPQSFEAPIHDAVSQVVAEPAFIKAATLAISTAHAELLDGDQQIAVVVDLADFESDITSAVRSVDPQIAALVPNVTGLGPLRFDFASDAFPDFAREAGWIRSGFLIAVIVAACALVLAVALSRRRARTLRNIGIGLLALTLLPFILRVVVPGPATSPIPDASLRPPAQALIRAFFNPYIVVGLIVGAIGLALVLAGIGLGRMRKRKLPGATPDSGPAATPAAPAATAVAASAAAPTPVRVQPPPGPGTSGASSQPPAPEQAAPTVRVNLPGDAATSPPEPDPFAPDSVGWEGSKPDRRR